jgi:hypothetical protein
MSPDALALVGDALALRSEGFTAILAAGAPGTRIGLLVVFAAGLSTAIGQSVILFAHRVSPRRFGASLLVQAVLFTAGFLTWVVATSLVAGTLFDRPRPVGAAFATIGLAHAPQLLGFFVLTPYFGTPLATALSVWTLLATLLATAAAFDLTAPEAAACAGLGWLLAQLVQRTVGRPITRVGRYLRDRVAGVELRRRPAP